MAMVWNSVHKLLFLSRRIASDIWRAAPLPLLARRLCALVNISYNTKQCHPVFVCANTQAFLGTPPYIWGRFSSALLSPVPQKRKTPELVAQARWKVGLRSLDPMRLGLRWSPDRGCYCPRRYTGARAGRRRATSTRRCPNARFRAPFGILVCVSIASLSSETLQVPKKNGAMRERRSLWVGGLHGRPVRCERLLARFLCASPVEGVGNDPTETCVLRRVALSSRVPEQV